MFYSNYNYKHSLFNTMILTDWAEFGVGLEGGRGSDGWRHLFLCKKGSGVGLVKTSLYIYI